MDVLLEDIKLEGQEFWRREKIIQEETMEEVVVTVVRDIDTVLQEESEKLLERLLSVMDDKIAALVRLKLKDTPSDAMSTSDEDAVHYFVRKRQGTTRPINGNIGYLQGRRSLSADKMDKLKLVFDIGYHLRNRNATFKVNKASEATRNKETSYLSPKTPIDPKSGPRFSMIIYDEKDAAEDDECCTGEEQEEDLVVSGVSALRSESPEDESARGDNISPFPIDSSYDAVNALVTDRMNENELMSYAMRSYLKNLLASSNRAKKAKRLKMPQQQQQGEIHPSEHSSHRPGVKSAPRSVNKPKHGVFSEHAVAVSNDVTARRSVASALATPSRRPNEALGGVWNSVNRTVSLTEDEFHAIGMEAIDDLENCIRNAVAVLIASRVNREGDGVGGDVSKSDVSANMENEGNRVITRTASADQSSSINEPALQATETTSGVPDDRDSGSCISDWSTVRSDSGPPIEESSLINKYSNEQEVNFHAADKTDEYANALASLQPMVARQYRMATDAVTAASKSNNNSPLRLHVGGDSNIQGQVIDASTKCAGQIGTTVSSVPGLTMHKSAVQFRVVQTSPGALVLGAVHDAISRVKPLQRRQERVQTRVVAEKQRSLISSPTAAVSALHQIGNRASPDKRHVHFEVVNSVEIGPYYRDRKDVSIGGEDFDGFDLDGSRRERESEIVIQDIAFDRPSDDIFDIVTPAHRPPQNSGSNVGVLLLTEHMDENLVDGHCQRPFSILSGGAAELSLPIPVETFDELLGIMPVDSVSVSAADIVSVAGGVEIITSLDEETLLNEETAVLIAEGAVCGDGVNNQKEDIAMNASEQVLVNMIESVERIDIASPAPCDKVTEDEEAIAVSASSSALKVARLLSSLDNVEDWIALENAVTRQVSVPYIDNISADEGSNRERGTSNKSKYPELSSLGSGHTPLMKKRTGDSLTRGDILSVRRRAAATALLNLGRRKQKSSSERQDSSYVGADEFITPWVTCRMHSRVDNKTVAAPASSAASTNVRATKDVSARAEHIMTNNSILVKYAASRMIKRRHDPHHGLSMASHERGHLSHQYGGALASTFTAKATKLQHRRSHDKEASQGIMDMLNTSLDDSRNCESESDESGSDSSQSFDIFDGRRSDVATVEVDTASSFPASSSPSHSLRSVVGLLMRRRRPSGVGMGTAAVLYPESSRSRRNSAALQVHHDTGRRSSVSRLSDARFHYVAGAKSGSRRGSCSSGEGSDDEALSATDIEPPLSRRSNIRVDESGDSSILNGAAMTELSLGSPERRDGGASTEASFPSGAHLKATNFAPSFTRRNSLKRPSVSGLKVLLVKKMKLPKTAEDSGELAMEDTDVVPVEIAPRPGDRDSTLPLSNAHALEAREPVAHNTPDVISTRTDASLKLQSDVIVGDALTVESSVPLQPFHVLRGVRVPTSPHESPTHPATGDEPLLSHHVPEAPVAVMLRPSEPELELSYTPSSPLPLHSDKHLADDVVVIINPHKPTSPMPSKAALQLLRSPRGAGSDGTSVITLRRNRRTLRDSSVAKAFPSILPSTKYANAEMLVAAQVLEIKKKSLTIIAPSP